MNTTAVASSAFPFTDTTKKRVHISRAPPLLLRLPVCSILCDLLIESIQSPTCGFTEKY